MPVTTLCSTHWGGGILPLPDGETEAPSCIHSINICGVPPTDPDPGPVASDSGTRPLPPIHRRRRSKPKHCSPRPLWKLQETAASTLIGLSGLADLQRAGESQHPYATAAALAWEWPQGRGQTAGTAIPGIAPLSSEQASETLCFGAPACLHAQRAPTCFVHPGPSPRQGKLFFLASQCSRNPQLFPVKTSMAGPTPVCGVQSECKAVYTVAPSTTSPDSSVSPTHTCPVPTSQGHPHPRLWGCKAQGGQGRNFSQRGWRSVPHKTVSGLGNTLREEGEDGVE